MRMNCSEAQAELPLFVGGDLESSCHERVAVHLETCEPCRSALAGANEAREVLRAGLNRTADLHGAFVASSAAPSVWSGLRDQLHAEGLIRTVSNAQPSTSSVATVTPPVVEATVSANGSTPAPAGKLLFWVSRSAAAAALLMFGAVAGQMWNGGLDSSPAGPGVGPMNTSSPVVQGQPVGLNGSTGMLAEVAVPTPAALTPVEHPSSGGLQEVLRHEDTFLYSDQNTRYPHGRGYAPSNAFRNRSGNTMVSGAGGALPAATVRTDGVR